MGNVRRERLWYAETITQSSFVSAYQSHKPVHYSCAKHHLQGVWGAARHPSGEREGRSPLASATRNVRNGERDGYPLGVEPTRIRKAEYQQRGTAEYQHT